MIIHITIQFLPPLPTKQKSWNSRCCVTPDHPLLKYVLDFCAWSENKVFTPFFSKTFPSSRCQQILWTALIFKEGRNSPLVCWPFDRIFGSGFWLKMANMFMYFLLTYFFWLLLYVYPRRIGVGVSLAKYFSIICIPMLTQANATSIHVIMNEKTFHKLTNRFCYSWINSSN